MFTQCPQTSDIILQTSDFRYHPSAIYPKFLRVEEMVKDINEGSTIGQTAKNVKTSSTLPKELKTMQSNLSKKLGAKMQMKYADGKGKITIPFANDKEMQKIIALLSKIK